MQTVTSADGTEIAYERQGSGRPLLLLHGGGNHEFWAPIAPAFDDEFAVVRPDRRGYGASDDADDYSLDREVEDVRAVLGAIEDDPAVTDADPILVGHSFGGLEAIATAREEPVAAVAPYEPAILVGEYRETSDLADRMERHLEAGEPREAMKRHLREVLHTDDTDDEAFEAWLDEWPHWPEAAAGARRTYRMDRAVEAFDLPETLDLGAPGLVLTGTEGPQHLRDSSRALEASLTDGDLVEFEGVSHFGPAEAPERVTEAIRSFFDENGLLASATAEQ